MKNLVTILSTLSLSLTAVAAPQTSSFTGAGLSRCEQDLVASMGPTRAEAWKNAALGVGGGVVAGGLVFGVGSALQSSGSSSEVVGDGLFGTGVSEPNLTGIIISAVATGTVIALVGVAGANAQYRETVAQQEALLQLFKDVRNNGMGPLIDMRVSAIQKALKKIKLKTAGAILKATGVNFNDQSLSEGEIRLALMQVVSEAASSKVIDCSKPEELSDTLDTAAIRIVIEKFNPSLSAKMQ